ncbi:MAG: penicillin-binding protein 2 [Elusimicrobiota bacterium]|jgi:cell division protein FtsI (penicillin-binding protein 3)|nr:penicillin-binding protein 2 [Elusimicrobiota bacterium]
MKTPDKSTARIKFVKGCVFLGFLLLILRLGYVQIIYSSTINKMVSRLIGRESIEEAKRGDILDANGRILATSIRRYVVFLDARKISDFQAVKKVLSDNAITFKQNSLQALGDNSYVPVAYNLSEDVVEKIRKQNVAGIGFESKYTRQYPEGSMSAHILGVIGTDGKGMSGVEQEFESYLSGTNVRLKQKRDGTGSILSEEIVDKSDINGSTVQLTIDMNIQFIVEQELKKALVQSKAKNAVGIVQNPKTGEILAMVTLPDFSPSEKIMSLASLRNYAVSDMFEPGSTFKIVVVAAALDMGEINLTDSFFLENGSMKIGGHRINDDHIISGRASVETIMAMSSNIGVVKIAQKIGKDSFYMYMRKFGFYSLSGIELPGEARGKISDVRQWDNFYLPSASFGQGIAVTAIQMVGAFSVLANDGVLMKPVIVKEIDGQGLSQHFAPTQTRRVVSSETVKEMRQILTAVVEKGTGRAAKVSGYSVAGKTGTAQKYDPTTKTYSKKHYISSFAGMFPASNPEIVILILVDEPVGDYYASSISAPVFKRIAQRIAAYLNIPKDE